MKKHIRLFAFAFILTAVIFSSTPFVSPVNAESGQGAANGQPKTALPTLYDFSSTLLENKGEKPAGLYVFGQMALPIIQQPSGNPGYVSEKANVVTQFNMASQYGTLGLLAHNTLAGAKFAALEVGQYAEIVYGGGRVDYYRITAVERYQALSPLSLTSDFVDASGDGPRMSATTLFNHVYAPGHRLVLQTCIEAQGNTSWGRLFIIAEPVTDQFQALVQQASYLLQTSAYDLLMK